MNVGIDLVKISRFKKSPYDNNESFYKKNFSSDEIEYCLKFNNPYIHFAGKFAIKEAVKKTMRERLELFEIVTFYDNEKPCVKILDRDLNFKVSVSHDGDYAIAIVISE